MKTNFKLLSIICLTAICLTNCSVIDVLDKDSVNIRFKNISSDNFEEFTFDNQSIGLLNTDEITEYITFDFRNETFANAEISALLENVTYSKDLSLMIIEPDLGYCGVGLEDKIMLEQNKNFTFEVYIDKENPNTLKVNVLFD